MNASPRQELEIGMRWFSLATVLFGVFVVGFTASAAERLTGQRFFEVMQRNTVSGTTTSGADYNLNFLAGGAVTYEDSEGTADRGQWQIDPDGDVCIEWTERNPGQETCYRVSVDGTQVSWQSKTGSGEAVLRGSIATGFIEQ